jgi:hypothetical protein
MLLSNVNWYSTAAIRTEAVSRILLSRTELTFPYMSMAISAMKVKKKTGMKISSAFVGFRLRVTEKTYWEYVWL